VANHCSAPLHMVCYVYPIIHFLGICLLNTCPYRICCSWSDISLPLRVDIIYLNSVLQVVCVTCWSVLHSESTYNAV